MGWYRGAQIVQNGLILNLDASNPKSYIGSGTTWKDLSGNKSNSTLINGVSFSGNSMVFDGINDYCSLINNKIISVNTFTIDVMVNWGAFITNNLGYAIFDSHSGSTAGYSLYQNTVFPFNSFKCFVNTSNGLASIVSPTLLSINKWYHTIMKYDGIKLYLYINGILDSSTPATGSMVFAVPSVSVIGTSFNSYFTGKISSFRIYNRSLTDIEIQQNYNASKSKFGF